MPADRAPVAIARRADRVRLERERELAELARLMRQPASLADAPEPVPLHRKPVPAAVTALPVTAPGPQGSLTTPARAVPGIGARRGERPPAVGAYPAGLAGESLLHLPSQPPDRCLGRAQLGDHPWLDGHLPDEGIEAVDAAGRDDIREPPLRGMPGHVTTISVTPEPETQHRAGRDATTERTTTS